MSPIRIFRQKFLPIVQLLGVIRRFLPQMVGHFGLSMSKSYFCYHKVSLAMTFNTYLFFLVTFVGLLFGSQKVVAQSILINEYSLSADGADILVTWEVPNEADITEYRLFRRRNNETTLTHVTTVASNGSGKYSYLDGNIFKTESRVLHYELHIVQGNTVIKYERSISHNPTSIQRTWGSIKAMFRD